MAEADLPSQSTLHKLLMYDPHTGVLSWRLRPAEFFANSGRGGSEGQASRWNGRWAGKRAGTLHKQSGYIYLSLPKVGGGSIRVLGHRTIWCHFFGVWPKLQIDHVNGLRHDNRIANLREASNKHNARNMTLMASNTSGVCGVYWERSVGKWCAQIIVDGKRVYLGVFDKIDGAISARKAADRRFGFSDMHGKTKLVDYPAGRQRKRSQRQRGATPTADINGTGKETK